MCHGCGFICHLCLQLKLKINTRSLSNQALKSARRSLLSSRCWHWGVFSSWLTSRDLGTARFSYLARVGPMIRVYGGACLKKTSQMRRDVPLITYLYISRCFWVETPFHADWNIVFQIINCWNLSGNPRVNAMKPTVIEPLKLGCLIRPAEDDRCYYLSIS